MNKMPIETLIAYLEDFKKNLVPGKHLYVKVNGTLLVCSDKACKIVQASIWIILVNFIENFLII